MLVTRPTLGRPFQGTVSRPTPAVASYIAAAGVAAVSVVRKPDGRMGHSVATDLGTQNREDLSYWVANRNVAARVARLARRLAGPNPTEQAAVSAIFDAAKREGVRLVPHAVVMLRAARAAELLDGRLSTAAAEGRLKYFHAEYRRRRTAALARGESFISFSAAHRRLRRIIVERAISGDAASNIFEEVFDGNGNAP